MTATRWRRWEFGGMLSTHKSAKATRPTAYDGRTRHRQLTRIQLGWRPKQTEVHGPVSILHADCIVVGFRGRVSLLVSLSG